MLGVRLAVALLVAAIVALGAAWQNDPASASEVAGTFGKTSVGASSDWFGPERKRVNRYPLSVSATVTKLSIYLAPTSTSGQQVLKGIVYSDASGKPEALLGLSEQLTFKSTNSAGWYELVFAAPLKLATGNYWIGVITGPTSSVAGLRYDSVSESRDYNANAYASGPTNPFGSVTVDSKQTSLYASYTTQGSPPANTAPPTITGTAQQGQTLTEAHGTWTNSPTSFTYQWQQCDAFGNGCLPISGATAQTYVPAAGDVGHTIRVQETASNAGGSSAPATSTASATVLPPPPANTAPPSITGTAQQGQTLTEAHGSWSNSPTSFTYQWQQCDSSGNGCLPISGATGQSYVPVAGDVGRTLRVQETASNEGGAGTAASSAASATVIPLPPSNTAPPRITGTAQQGQTLTEHNGSWTNNPTSYAYQWLQCDAFGAGCIPISGATSQTYVPVAGDVGHTIAVQEVASNAGGSGAPATSESTGLVVPEGATPSNTAPPTITGTAQQGQTLTEHHGSWTKEPSSFSYQWQQCDGLGNSCLPIAGATGQSYVPVAGDVGHTIRVQETASNAGGSSAPASSAATAVVVPPPPSNTASPSITGTAQQGQTLTEAHGSWTNSPTSFTYQWQQCDSSGNNCTAISGATAQAYVPVAGDVGHTIRVQETAGNAGGSSAPASSAATAVVVASAPTNTSPPSIAGTAQQGKMLTEIHGSWTNSPTSFSYQWQQCDGLGNGCLPIAGATGQSYVPVAGDVGHTIGVQETASNAGGSSAPASSAATAVVAPPPPSNTASPSITGTAQQGKTLTEVHGTWTNSPTSFTYQWQQCDSSGNNCIAISGATAQTYVPVAGDVGHTLRVLETASNSGGASAPATSAQTAVVPQPASGTFGKTSVGASLDWFGPERKRVNRYSLSVSATVTKLSIYLAPTSTSGQQVLKGIVYSDASGKPEALLGVSEQLTFNSTNSAGWYDLGFGTPLKLAAGNYWIGVITGPTSSVAGFRYDTVTSSRDYNANTYSSGPTNPFGSVTIDGEQPSLYASYSSSAPPSEDPVLAAEGDIACPAGDTKHSCQQLATANLTASQHPTALVVLGDNQYNSGLLSEFNSAGAYNDTWGQFNPIVHPAPGNHEYGVSSSASGYFSYFGSSAGNGDYSWELGSWHLISLNSDCTDSGCRDSIAGSTSSAAVSWLQSDLAAHANQCILAYWHHPRFSSGFVGNSPGVAPFWNALYAGHADAVLNGHDHMYERFAQQDPAQSPTSEGIREFVVGTGGESLFAMGTTQPNMQAVDNGHFGVLLLTLHRGSYDWAFRATNGSVLDSGSASCHRQPAGALAAALGAAGTASLAPAQGELPAVQSGAGLAPSATPDAARLTFAARTLPTTLRSAVQLGVPVDVYCSRACNVTVAVRVRVGRQEVTIANYRETETEIPRPASRVLLPLPGSAIAHLGNARLELSFAAVDASNEWRTVTRTLALRRH